MTDLVIEYCPVCYTYSTVHTEFRAIYYYFHYWYMHTQLTPLLQKHKVSITGGLFNNYTIKMRSLLQKVLNSQKFTAYTIQGRRILLIMSWHNILRPTQEMLLLVLVSYCIQMLKNNIISLGTTCYQRDNTHLCQQVEQIYIHHVKLLR